ncbi:hypothetical protein CONPUDRAFT_140303 [Coniophora puteana RWD-64-598 SS2]|uniref:DUF6534 domain-containing protein n=1 Tax=Coniophora puteana (strain RWD-64-598) TaxID=741705 RepID=A0A5M3M6B2_CONPW|nr:uncharacterized protein CONPUDRAFT_140303 [Coniophora puteana RWD-64-598 SS2]EIW74912.1 hypothetical protein CONPUDRAFT_140303 [Coniophora puteana RWD-64-598 SS2]
MGQYDTSVGLMLIGVFFNTYLYGLVTYQFLCYWRAYYSDRLALRAMIMFLFALDTFHAATVIWMSWFYLVQNFANPVALGEALWPYTFTPIATAFAAVVTQVYLAWRIWKLSESNVLFGISLLLVAPSFILGCMCGIRAWMIHIMAQLAAIDNIVTGWLITQVMADIFITGTLAAILARSKTGFKRTDSVLNRLIRGAIQTGLFASIFSIGCLVSFLAWPTTQLYGMFAIPVGRIYTNTLLDTLLSRKELRKEMFGNMDTIATTNAEGPRTQSAFAFAHTEDTATGMSVPVPLSELRKMQQEMDSQNSDDREGSISVDGHGSRRDERNDMPLDGKRETLTV